jgi:hypothetical protein
MKRSAIKPLITRRKLMTAGAAATAAPLLSGCEQISDAPQFRFFLEFGRLASLRGQRLLLARQPLAREYAMADISPDFPPNGTAMPPSPQYRQMMMRGFEDWHLAVDGLVRTPQTYSPSTAAWGGRGARKASEIVMLTWRGLQSSRSAISVTPLTAPVSI